MLEQRYINVTIIIIVFNFFLCHFAICVIKPYVGSLNQIGELFNRVL